MIDDATEASAELPALPVLRASELQSSALTHKKWLIEGLWASQGVGVIGGTPKSCKTWLALELAVAVASGVDAIGHFPVTTPGPVLAYAAEDAAAELHQRLVAISASRTVALANLDLFLLDVPTLHLDSGLDRRRLARTLEQIQPRLLLLDPLVRLHRGDENSAGEMAALLGELRLLQRRHGVAIMLVHHLRKNATSTSGGQALRGSGDLHAWGDSNLYLCRRDSELTLSVEQRSAHAIEPFRLELRTEPAPHLHIIDAEDVIDPRAVVEISARVLALLDQCRQTLTRDQIRAELRIRNATLGRALMELRSQNLIERSVKGFRLQPHPPVPVPPPT